MEDCLKQLLDIDIRLNDFDQSNEDYI